MSSDSESEAPRQAFPLLRAAYDGDLHALRRAITEGADPNEQDGYTVLQWLIVHGCRNGADTQLACISALVEAGADVNMKSGPSRNEILRSTPLLDAVFRCEGSTCRELVSLLIRAGADVTITNGPTGTVTGPGTGLTPLHTAAIFGRHDVIPLLIAAGADVNAIYYRSYDEVIDYHVYETPLDSCLKRCFEELPGRRARVFAALLRAGARIPARHRIDRARDPYLDAVARAGGYARYERAHRTRLAAIFIPKFPRVPAEIIRTIVAFWADCGGH